MSSWQDIGIYAVCLTCTVNSGTCDLNREKKYNQNDKIRDLFTFFLFYTYYKNSSAVRPLIGNKIYGSFSLKILFFFLSEHGTCI